MAKKAAGLTGLLALMGAGCPPVDPDPNDPDPDDPDPDDPDPDPDNPPPTDGSGPANRAEAVRFLTQATFGPSETALGELMDIGSYNEWITQQFAKTPSLTQPYVMANSNGSLQSTRHFIWWENAIRGEDQLRQRLAFAWSQVFVVSDRDYQLSNSQYGVCNFYDMLATESTGNFRTMLERVTLHPVMGVYLSMVRNEKANVALNIRPDENYAREVMQLFTIGLQRLAPNGEVQMSGGEPIETYDQRTVEEFARVFTGWNYSDSRSYGDTNFRSTETPMTPWEEFHDTGAKDLLNGARIPAGGTTRSDLKRALDNIFNHPNVGPFLARLLIQRLVTSNPTPAYVGRVAQVFNNDGTGTRGNLAAVSRAILTDAEARTGHQTLPARFGKIKEPIMRLTQVWRAFDAVPGPTGNGIYKASTKPMDQIESVVAQAPMRSQSVFNFYSPDNPLEAGSPLKAPELSILTEISVAATNNMLFLQIYNYNSQNPDDDNEATIDIEAEIAMAADPERLVNHLSRLLLTSPLPAPARIALIGHLQTHPNTPEGLLNRTTDAIYGIVGSPFHLVQK